MKCILENHEMSLIKKMEYEASQMSGVISLAQGIPWYPIPDAIESFVMSKISSGETNRYSSTQGIPQLREQVALKYYKDFGFEIDYNKEITITAGAIQAISSILLTFVGQGDEVIIIDPCYASYSGCILTTKGKINSIELAENFNLDVDKIISTINSQTRAIIIANPNNPTGSIFSLESIKKILDYINGKNIVLILDEVYDEFLYDGNEYTSSVSLFNKYKDNLIIVNSWSKTFGMTGWRIGYFIANEYLTKEILKVHDGIITCAPVHSQWAAIASFEIYDTWTKKIKIDLQKRRDYAIEKCSKLDGFIEFNKPMAAYFLFPKFKYTNDDYNECLKILKEAKLALVPGSGFGSIGKGHFRLCFGRDFNDLEEGLNRLEKYFNA